MWINLPLKIVHNKHNNFLLFDRNYSEQLQNYCKEEEEEEEVLFSLFVVMHQHHDKFLVFKKILFGKKHDFEIERYRIPAD